MLKTTIILALLIAIAHLPGCATSEEVRQARQQKARQVELQRERNIASVRKQLRGYVDQGRLMTFRARTPRHLEPVLFDYLNRLGATMTSYGRSEFEIQVDTTWKRRCPGWVHRDGERWYHVTVKIYDQQGLGGSKNLILVGESNGCSHYHDKDRALRTLTEAALYKMRF